jgi:hypothetical protein
MLRCYIATLLNCVVLLDYSCFGPLAIVMCISHYISPCDIRFNITLSHVRRAVWHTWFLLAIGIKTEIFSILEEKKQEANSYRIIGLDIL